MPKPKTKTEKKAAFLETFDSLIAEFDKILVVDADNVRSIQMARIRLALRNKPDGRAQMIMGKNTMVRRVLKNLAQAKPEFEALNRTVRGNVGFIFYSGGADSIVDILEQNRVKAAAKSGSVAPCDVTVPAGPTGMEPTMTSFFQALNIATKINKGSIEIITAVDLLKEGQKVGNSEAVLLKKLNITPFSYGLVVKCIYDQGSVYDAAVLKITNDDVKEYFLAGALEVAKLSLGASFPTLPALPHILINAYKDLLSVAFVTDYTFDRAEQLKNKAAAGPAPAAAAAAAPAAAAAAAPVEESEEEDAAFDLFD
jgi:large subunit ribosomal protein LP0